MALKLGWRQNWPTCFKTKTIKVQAMLHSSGDRVQPEEDPRRGPGATNILLWSIAAVSLMLVMMSCPRFLGIVA